MKAVKKIGSNLIWSLVVLVIGGFLSLENPNIAEARHAVDPKCYTFTGITDEVPPGNSGQIDFDARSGQHDYQACGEVNGQNLDISGWAWNTNLGDISFRCTGGDNFGAACGGAVNYGSAIVNDAGTDYLVGYAWGDNVGWVSLGCRDYDGDGVTLENYILGVVDNGIPGNRVECGSIEYQTEIDASGALAGYGYSEYVGWMSMIGAIIDWPALEVDKGSDLDGDGLKDEIVPEGFPADPALPAPEMPEGRFTYVDGDGNVRGYAYANGEDYYEVRVQLTEDDVPMTCAQAALRTPLMWLTHNGATINHDQIDGASPGAVSATDFTCSGDTYSARVTSLAPTGIAPNGITYQTFTVDSLTLTMDDFRGVRRSITQTMGDSLTFVPAVYIDSFESKDSSGDWQNLLYASRNTPVPVRFIGGRYRAKGQVPVNSEISIYGSYSPELPEANPYTFYDDPTGDGPELLPDGTIDPDLNSSDFDFDVENNLLDGAAIGDTAGVNTDSPYQRYVYAYSSDPDAPASQSNSASSELRVEYTTVLSGTPVRYITSEMSAGITFNQFAQLRGNLRLEEGSFQEVVSRQVSLDCEGDTCEKRAQTGLPSGEYAKPETKERLNKILIEKFRGKSGPGKVKQVPSGATIEITESQLLSDGDHILYYKPSPGNTKPYSVIFTEPITDPTLKPTTVICEGCDFYINASISNGTAGSPPTIKLGLIALEDKTIRSGRRGGNIYVHANVTETSLHIFADGSLLSYSDETPIDADGIPDFSSLDPSQILKNQYTNYGRIRSSNTLGGSTLIPAITGDGEKATTTALQLKARAQDLNFLRYAKTVQNPIPPYNPDLSIEQNINEDNGPPYWWATTSGMQLSPSLGTGDEGDPYVINYPLEYGIVNFFDTPPSGLPIFEALSKIAR